MNRKLAYPRSFVFAGSIVAVVALLTCCLGGGGGKRGDARRAEDDQAPVIMSLRGKRYAGDLACRACHQALYDSMITTAHYLTSRKAEPKYVGGSFAPGQNEFRFDAHRVVRMEEKDGELWQTEYTDGQPTGSARMDIVTGSGRKGQTFAYWKDKELYQLPITWFSAMHAWANSPGFSADRISFERHIEARCLECHTTFAKQLSEHEFEPTSILYGVSCERCHGPAGEHVDWERQHPGDHSAGFIVNPARLSRQQKLDACALCHSGVLSSLGPAFLFQPGDTLSQFFNVKSAHVDSVNLDVHANQYGLLTASKCFRMSRMDCSSCHDPHVRERGDLAAYGTKCMGCHGGAGATGGDAGRKGAGGSDAAGGNHYCRFIPPPGFDMRSHCVDCHMPVRASHNLTMQTAGRSGLSPEFVRTHRIAIYPDVVEGVRGAGH